MRAKNEFRLISEAYNIKLLAEKAVDGTLMCSKDCCGSPVMECKCGDDCKHCNCFMIQKAVKDFGLKSPLLEGIVPEDERDEPIRNRELPVGHYDHMVRLSKNYPEDNPWSQSNVQVRKTEKELIQKFLDKGYRIVKPPAEDYERFQNPYDDYVDDDAREQARRDDELMGDIELPPDYKPTSSEDVKKRMAALDREIKMAHARGREDNEEPKRSITGMRQKLDALAAAQLAGSKHKPYVSSFVGDGGKKIFAILGSDGKIVHKTHNKQEAYQWLKDNYENV